MKYKRQIIYSFFFCLGILTCKAQDTFYDYITLGKNRIGFDVTLLFDSAIQYQQYGYNGPAPIFAKIWYPIEDTVNLKYLKFGDFNTDRVPAELAEVHRELSKHMDELFIRDGITYDIVTDAPIDYGNISTQEVLDRIKLTETKSIATEITSKMDYPVIVYHHGAQGLSIENTIMGEYFASKGYIFISANFHLPYPNTIYGLLPYNLENEKMHRQSTAKAVIQYAKTLTTHNNLTYIGHSWGAQEGWCFLNDSVYATAFVSMETTLEYRTDTATIKETWPYVYDALKTKQNKFSIPILLFAAYEQNMRFDFFKGLSNKEMIYASYKKPFTHNSYTSLLMMRYFLHNTLPQTDSEIMLTQIKGYAAHLYLISAFLESLPSESKIDLTPFNPQFIITQEE